MRLFLASMERRFPHCAQSARRVGGVVAFLLTLFLGGCAAITNPVADGVPVRRLPPELLAPSREIEKTIPLNLLRQPQPEVYRLEARDVLGVYIDGVLGDRTQLPPVRLAPEGNLPPAMGYPVPVREDGTISLPFVPAISVKGMSLTEAEAAVRQAYTLKKDIIKPGRERIIVTLLNPRTYNVLVVRQDSGTGTGNTVPVTFGGYTASSEIVGPRKKGSGLELDLPAYQNDVLNALTRTGGLPGLDAKNEVYIFRGNRGSGLDPATALQMLEQCPDGIGAATGIIRIPLRLPPGAPLPFTPPDILLQSGDIVFVRARDPEVFYTGGLLISGQYPLPRDYDLDVVQAIALVRGPLINGGQNANNLTGQLQNGGIGFANPSLVSVIRRTPGHGQVVIHVDLNRALQDPRERILVKPDDLIILQNTIGEAVAQYVSEKLQFNFLGVLIRARDLTATSSATFP